jgi:hypothetical protein
MDPSGRRTIGWVPRAIEIGLATWMPDFLGGTSQALALQRLGVDEVRGAGVASAKSPDEDTATPAEASGARKSLVPGSW